jgi:hydrogenase maturation protein HypF
VPVAAAASSHARLRIRFRGAVQGVGFRPFLHALAARHGLSGFVLNDTDGVLAEIEGTAVDRFLNELQHEHPPLARIDGMDVTRVASQGHKGFAIRQSLGSGVGRAQVVPDATTCPACLDEIRDPASRFYRYPFVTCTNCGPRFTVTRSLPYDRANTSMASFALCEACSNDYANPASRRYHAESIACPECGPRLSHSIPQIAAALLGTMPSYLLCASASTVRRSPSR